MCWSLLLGNNCLLKLTYQVNVCICIFVILLNDTWSMVMQNLCGTFVSANWYLSDYDYNKKKFIRQEIWLCSVLWLKKDLRYPIRSGGWLCLVPTSTTRFASDVGYRMAKKLIGFYKEIIFMNNDIKFLNIEWRTPYPLPNFEDRFELRASVIFRLQYVRFPVHLYTV